MAELVADCPRCGANKITFDLSSAIKTRQLHGWQFWYEAFSICRQCLRSTVFVLSESVNGNYDFVHKNGLTGISGAVNRFVDVEGIVGLKDRLAEEPPEHVPDDIDAVFREGATCQAVGCYNAAGTMFRLCVDIATRGMTPVEDINGLNNRIRRNLGLRLPWLFDHGYLPEALRDLSSCLREDGNDGAHAGSLNKDDAADLLDFTRILLERMYTEPERLRVAEARRKERRSDNA
ncbi:DUF4145 domain-containing protein [Chromohalobacter moromii]|uniref:DUF4145 domain-containing protein n=1 Tax=Chromohalobacter moromii TaxID=2860329 RepID=A0A9X2X273_9GAMM|nr:DUF4145 domain-containing protein [Chromohalobacter moromii]MCT8505562.1 DUF4145 domain-containing protein [Chromohalobacter moromii]